MDWSNAVEYSKDSKGKGKGKKGKGSGKGKSSKGGATRNPINGRLQTNTVQVPDGEVEPGCEFADHADVPGTNPYGFLTVAQKSEIAQSMSFEDVAVQEEIVATPPGTSGQEQWLKIAGSESHQVYAWPRRIQGPSDVAEAFQQQ